MAGMYGWTAKKIPLSIYQQNHEQLANITHQTLPEQLSGIHIVVDWVPYSDGKYNGAVHANDEILTFGFYDTLHDAYLSCSNFIYDHYKLERVSNVAEYLSGGDGLSE